MKSHQQFNWHRARPIRRSRCPDWPLSSIINWRRSRNADSFVGECGSWLGLSSLLFSGLVIVVYGGTIILVPSLLIRTFTAVINIIVSSDDAQSFGLVWVSELPMNYTCCYVPNLWLIIIYLEVQTFFRYNSFKKTYDW